MRSGRKSSGSYRQCVSIGARTWSDGCKSRIGKRLAFFVRTSLLSRRCVRGPAGGRVSLPSSVCCVRGMEAGPACCGWHRVAGSPCRAGSVSRFAAPPPRRPQAGSAVRPPVHCDQPAALGLPTIRLPVVYRVMQDKGRGPEPLQSVMSGHRPAGMSCTAAAAGVLTLRRPVVYR